jgi:hypothetical protein
MVSAVSPVLIGKSVSGALDVGLDQAAKAKPGELNHGSVGSGSMG